MQPAWDSSIAYSPIEAASVFVRQSCVLYFNMVSQRECSNPFVNWTYECFRVSDVCRNFELTSYAIKLLFRIYRLFIHFKIFSIFDPYQACILEKYIFEPNKPKCPYSLSKSKKKLAWKQLKIIWPRTHQVWDNGCHQHRLLYPPK